MITVEGLEARGYRYFRNLAMAHKTGYVCLWQRAIRDARGIRFYVSIDVWADMGHGTGFSPKAQMTTADGVVFNAEMLLSGEGIDEVEAFFDRMWLAMGARHEQVTEEAADAA